MSDLDLTMYCPYCQKHTSIRMANAKYKGPHGGWNDTPAIWQKDDITWWWIGICNSCLDPVLVLRQGDTIYPHELPSPTDNNIPDTMRADLIEAKTCYCVSAYRGCAVLARRALQSTCLDKGAKKGDLISQLNDLKANGTITQELLEWATVVRWVGNDAAHPNSDPVTKEDSEDILKLTEQFLHVIYVTPAIAKGQRLKRGK